MPAKQGAGVSDAVESKLQTFKTSAEIAEKGKVETDFFDV